MSGAIFRALAAYALGRGVLRGLRRRKPVTVAQFDAVLKRLWTTGKLGLDEPSPLFLWAQSR